MCPIAGHAALSRITTGSMISEELSPLVAEAIPKATQIVVELLMQKIIINEEESHPHG